MLCVCVHVSGRGTGFALVLYVGVDFWCCVRRFKRAFCRRVLCVSQQFHGSALYSRRASIGRDFDPSSQCVAIFFWFGLLHARRCILLGGGVLVGRQALLRFCGWCWCWLWQWVGPVVMVMSVVVMLVRLVVTSAGGGDGSLTLGGRSHSRLFFRSANLFSHVGLFC